MNNNYNNNEKTNNEKKLFRNQNNKLVSGVCGGIANYFNVEPTWVRLAAILTCASGLGIIAYIAAAILVPSTDDNVVSKYRIHRKTETKMISGVCAGLAQYCKIEAKYMRVFFVMPFVLDLISPLGAGVFAPAALISYIALWILLPVDRTIAQNNKLIALP